MASTLDFVPRQARNRDPMQFAAFRASRLANIIALNTIDESVELAVIDPTVELGVIDPTVELEVIDPTVHSM